MSDTMLEFTPETLRDFTKKTEELRRDILFSTEDAGADPEAEQYFLLALTALETAHRYLSLAALKQTRALGDRR